MKRAEIVREAGLFLAAIAMIGGPLVSVAVSRTELPSTSELLRDLPAEFFGLEDRDHRVPHMPEIPFDVTRFASVASVTASTGSPASLGPFGLD